MVASILLALLVTGASTLAVVVWMQVEDAQLQLERDEARIRESLETKGFALTNNHAMALRNLALDNAFSDVRSLVLGAVNDDVDVIYGLFLDADEVPWAYTSPTLAPERQHEVGDSWRSLSPELVNVDVSKGPLVTIVEKHLFDASVIEFSAPIIADGEQLGAVFYGMSTDRMEQDLARTRRAADAARQRALTSLGFIALLGGLLGFWLAGRTASHITQPIATLTKAAGEVARGATDTRVEISTNDELQVLGHAFNRMAADLGTSYRQLEEINATLEQRVVERTQQVVRRNRDMRIVLDNVEQGLVTVRPDGTMTSECSRVVSRWFGAPTPGRSFAEFVHGVDSRFAGYFELVFEDLAADLMPREVLLAQLPRVLRTEKRTWEVSYVPVFDASAAATNGGAESSDTGEANCEQSQFAGLLVVMADITEQLARERTQQQQAEVLALLQRYMQDARGVTRFRENTAVAVEAIACRRFGDDIPAWLYALHTLKGNCGMFGLTVMVAYCHAIEDEVADSRRQPCGESIADLVSRWQELSRALGLFGVAETGATVTIETNELARLASELRADGRAEFAKRVQAWQAEPVSVPLGRLGEQARELARNQGLVGVEVTITAADVRLDADKWAPFWADLVHLVRNAVDHGLGGGSTTQPRIDLSARTDEGSLLVEVRDNGAGIDWAKVRDKARRLGLPAASHDDLVAALFADGLSTRERVTSISGRGVGLSALSRRCAQLGGRITVLSCSGGGTCVAVSVPCVGAAPDRQRDHSASVHREVV